MRRYALASALLVAGPAAVYFLPDDSTGLSESPARRWDGLQGCLAGVRRHSRLLTRCGPHRTLHPMPGAVAAQAAIALACVAGGSAAWGGASLLSSLQKS